MKSLKYDLPFILYLQTVILSILDFEEHPETKLKNAFFLYLSWLFLTKHWHFPTSHLCCVVDILQVVGI